MPDSANPNPFHLNAMSIPTLCRAAVCLTAGLLLSGAAWASKCDGVDAHGDTGGAYFEPDVPYEEDVFSFCAIGIPAHCWAPTGPGTWTQTCQYLNKKWIPKFERVCRRGGPAMGTWGPSARIPLNTKGDPRSSDGMTDCEHGSDF